MRTCSFCSRPENEVKGLIAASEQGPFICNRCIAEKGEMFGHTAPSSAVSEKKLLRPKEIKAFLDKHVISQEQAKIDISVAVYNHYKRREAKKRGMIVFGGSTDGITDDLAEVEIKKSNILLLGSSGSGKTELARTIAKMLGVPFYVADATKLTQAGYVGDDVETMLQGLIGDADGDVERAEWGIIFIDEIDKLARKSGRGASGYRDVTGEGVQQSLLRLVEGSRVAVPRSSDHGIDTIDTENILFIAAGSFAGIEEIVTKRINKTCRIGFGTNNTRRDLTLTEAYREVDGEDILEFGIIPELLGRLPILTCTLPLTEQELVRVLTEPKNALTKQCRASFALDAIDLVFTDGALRAIAREAHRRETGARALRSILEKVLKKYAFEAPGSNIYRITITEETVTGTKEAELEYVPTQKAMVG